MTIKQQILKALYKVIMLKGKFFPSDKDVQINKLQVCQNSIFYNIEVKANDGTDVVLSNYKGKKIVIVNTASDCGYTAQYDELESLFTEYKNNVVVLAFPANDFKNQETGNDASIAEFCRLNFGVRFPIMQKSSVVKGPQQHPIFKWLSHEASNGWCNQAPIWNFCKYIIDEEGTLTHFFSQNISPTSKQFIDAIMC
jgi:glutathione peroxidase